jgi:hypothetical protein
MHASACSLELRVLVSSAVNWPELISQPNTPPARASRRRVSRPSRRTQASAWLRRAASPAPPSSRTRRAAGARPTTPPQPAGQPALPPPPCDVSWQGTPNDASPRHRAARVRRSGRGADDAGRPLRRTSGPIYERLLNVEVAGRQRPSDRRTLLQRPPRPTAAGLQRPDVRSWVVRAPLPLTYVPYSKRPLGSTRTRLTAGVGTRIRSAGRPITTAAGMGQPLGLAP